MSEKTRNYNLTKPGLEDSANIEVLNENFDLIDAALKTGETDASEAAERIKNNTDIIVNESGGFAAGSGASADSGGAVGDDASTTDGGAVGRSASATDGFSGGKGARATVDAIQLGSGTNATAKSLQVYDYQLLDAAGHIPLERMRIKIQTSIPQSVEDGGIVFVVEA